MNRFKSSWNFIPCRIGIYLESFEELEDLSIHETDVMKQVMEHFKPRKAQPHSNHRIVR